MRRFFIRSGTTMVARAIPFGIGMVVGGAANHRLASQIVKSAHKTFGDLPEQLPQGLVADMERAQQRERLRAERKERRSRKRALVAQRDSKAKSQRESERVSAGEASKIDLDSGRPDAELPQG